MIKPSAADLRQLRRDNLQWPVALADVPKDKWPIPNWEGADAVKRFALLRSRAYLAQLFHEPGGIIRMSVQRTEWDERQNRFRDDISWDDLQRLKAEAGYGDRWAVEIFPADRAVVNVANMRHLWLLTEPPTFAWGWDG